jgi:hypothetical protein
MQLKAEGNKAFAAKDFEKAMFVSLAFTRKLPANAFAF